MSSGEGSPPAGKKAFRWLRDKILYSVGFGLLLLSLLSLVLFYFSDFRKPEPDVVRIAYAAGGPVRKHFLEEMARHGRKWNLDIQPVATDGTNTTLSQIGQGTVDLGLIAGAMEDRGARRIALAERPAFVSARGAGSGLLS